MKKTTFKEKVKKVGKKAFDVLKPAVCTIGSAALWTAGTIGTSLLIFKAFGGSFCGDTPSLEATDVVETISDAAADAGMDVTNI